MALRKEVKPIRLYFDDEGKNIKGDTVPSEADWIDIKETRNYGDTIHAQKAAAIKRIATKDSEEAQFDFDIVGFNLALLERMIVAWSDESEVTQESIQELPNSIIQFVLVEVTEVLEGEDEEEKKD